MSLRGTVVGFALSASHHHLERAIGWVETVVAAGADVIPIVSWSVRETTTAFGSGERWLQALRQVTGREPWTTIPEVEPSGPKRLFDVVVIAPCTGNTLARLANAITDSPVLMAAKAQLRNQRPVVLGITSNDVLGLNAHNLAMLLNTKNVYFVPFGQDDPYNKPNSVTARWELIVPTIEAALQGRQLQPLIVPFGAA